MVMINKKTFIAVLVLCFMFSVSSSLVYAKPRPKDGYHREYYEDGKTRRIEILYKKGQLIRRRAFYRNGKVKLDYQYRGNRVIKYRNFYESGKLKNIWTSKDNILKTYYENGKLRFTTEMPNVPAIK